MLETQHPVLGAMRTWTIAVDDWLNTRSFCSSVCPYISENVQLVYGWRVVMSRFTGYEYCSVRPEKSFLCISSCVKVVCSLEGRKQQKGGMPRT